MEKFYIVNQKSSVFGLYTYIYIYICMYVCMYVYIDKHAYIINGFQITTIKRRS